MKQVEKNDTVKVALVGTLDNETVFEVVEESSPRVFVLKEDSTPKPIKHVLLGMREGEMRKVRLEPEEGEFGIRRGDLLHEIPIKQFTSKIEPKVGLILSMNVESNGVTHQIPATIVELKPESVMIDYNHPLAGHPLNYNITVIEICRD
ncbi:MAG: FKBP-type peptidyl-prolyl cis-trans isomerase [Desulfocapsa sp.]|nr:FKBP-type peptidyl-prolyl cis-trans isomerase [Desulfocapsa sp.]